MAELLIGCGRARVKQISLAGNNEWKDLYTLDHEPTHNPDVVHDLEILPYPFGDNTFDEIHAYDVLEHTGSQGDAKFFFSQWMEFWRILKPDGLFFGIVPYWQSVWAWGDPSHKRVITVEQLGFLDQTMYKHVGTTAMSDFRSIWHGNFALIHQQLTPDNRQIFVLKKASNG